jgi:hypothetical protein
LLLDIEVWGRSGSGSVRYRTKLAGADRARAPIGAGLDDARARPPWRADTGVAPGGGENASNTAGFRRLVQNLIGFCFFWDTNVVFVRAVTHEPAPCFYNQTIDNALIWENIMGNSLHNKIYLGRASALGSKRMVAMLMLGALAAAGLGWLALNTLK